VAHQWQQKTAAALEENDAKALQEMLAVMNRKPGEAGAAKATAYFVAKDHSKQFTSVSLFSIALVSPAGLLVNIFFSFPYSLVHLSCEIIFLLVKGKWRGSSSTCAASAYRADRRTRDCSRT
jgi:hypothetical protein